MLDNWFEVIGNVQCEGKCYRIRYCDVFFAVSRTDTKRKFSSRDWKNTLESMGGISRGKEKNWKLGSLQVKTSRKKFRSKIRAMKEWIKTHRKMPLELMFKNNQCKNAGILTMLWSDR